ncbi:MAG: hypothetical protein KatS3mg043_1145 [Rhodothermaceae bacterium]|nr:MAG: hypothetical protein KatS3mg043_1145 [Rhodothermaceae bacterium]
MSAPWTDPRSPDVDELFPWVRSGEAEAEVIGWEARRYCPELPFRPVPGETWTKEVAFYEDYRLVRLAPAGGDREVYGFYAPGDFRPLDGSGRAIERLNRLGPLNLTFRTVLDYTLLRVRLELPHHLGAGVAWRRAGVVDDLAALPVEGRAEAARAGVPVANPVVRMVPAWEARAPAGVPRGDAFHVAATAVLYHEDAAWELVQVLAKVEPDGVLAVRRDALRSGRLRPAWPGPRVFGPLRTRTAMAVRRWYRPGEEDLPEALQRRLGDTPGAWHTLLRERYGLGEEGSSRHPVLLRVADLAFYRTFCLLEVLERRPDGYRRSYALARMRRDGPELRPLNGSSAVIHETNDEPDELLLNEETADEYLRFFCWAVHGDEGPFYLPASLRELPLRAAPSRAQRDLLHDVRFGVHAHPPFEASVVRRRAHLLYGAMVFKAWFQLKAGGEVEMVEDARQEELGELPVDSERFDEGDLFRLRETAQETAETPEGQDVESLFRKTRENLLKESPHHANALKEVVQVLHERPDLVPAMRDFAVVLGKLLPLLSPDQIASLRDYLHLIEKTGGLLVRLNWFRLSPEEQKQRFARLSPAQQEALAAADPGEVWRLLGAVVPEARSESFPEMAQALRSALDRLSPVQRADLVSGLAAEEQGALKDALHLLHAVLHGVSPEAFLRELEAAGTAAGREVNGPLVFSSATDGSRTTPETGTTDENAG